MIFATAALLSVSALAQDSIYNHNLHVTVGGGMNSMVFQPTDGKAKLGGGALLEAQYQYMFNEHWGVGVGLGFTTYHSSALFNYKDQIAPEAIHPDNGETYTPLLTMDNLKEGQNMLSIDIPVQAIWRHQLNAKWGLEAGLGLSLNFPVWMQYNIQSGSYGLAGYFESIHGTVQNLENHGFTQVESGEKGRIDHKGFNLGIQGDFGATYQLSDRMALYCGLYLNGQTINAIREHDCMVEHIDGNTLSYTNTMNTQNVTKVNPIEFGVKVGLTLGMGEKKPTKAYAAYLAEQERLRAEEEAARLAAEQAERDRLAREAAERAERERLAREQAERERLAAEEAAKAEEAEVERRAAMISTMQGAVTFGYNSYEPIFNEAAQEQLKDLALLLKQNPELNVYLTGHTDNIGSAEGNLRAGMKRAVAYKNALVKQGIPAERIFTDSKGMTEPIADNATEEGRAKNRRVDMNIR